MNKTKKAKKVSSYQMNEGSLVIMSPGCQLSLNHCVRAEIKSSNSEPQVRYSLSFRGLAKESSKKSPVKELIQTFDDRSNSPSSSPIPAISSPDSHTPLANHPVTTPHQPKKKICLLAGDSFTARLDVKRLGKLKKDVRSIAEGGSRISDVEGTLEKFSLDNPEVTVEKLFVSIGTNDIRWCQNGVSHLKGPVKKLFSKIKTLFHGCKVFIQCVLPLPGVHKNVVRNVRGINNILYNCCSHAHFYYLNVFNSFLDKGF